MTFQRPHSEHRDLGPFCECASLDGGFQSANGRSTGAAAQGVLRNTRPDQGPGTTTGSSASERLKRDLGIDDGCLMMRIAFPRARVIRVMCFVAASGAAAYLWAVIFGDGIPGLKDGASLWNADSIPDANFAFVAAVAIYLFISPFSAWWWSDMSTGHRQTVTWFGSSAVTGSVVFAVSRLFV
jgi:hypothetical protein